MLYKLHTNIFIVGFLTFGFMAAMVRERSFSIMTLGVFYAFVTQVLLLLYYSNEKERNYRERNLFWSSLIYVVMCGSLFMAISYYYDGDTFMLSKTDAMLYYDNSIKTAEIGLVENVKRITSIYSFEDCGAMIFDSIIIYIVSDKLFLNAVYMLTGAFSAVMLFRIGKNYMPESYAFLAALGYSTSSYLIFFHCSFLKESIFVFLVISAMYHFYRVIAYKRHFAFIGVALSLIGILFFRPAITAFLVVSLFTYYAVEKRGSALSFFLYIIIAVVFVISITVMQGMVDKYTGGDMDALVEYSSAKNYSQSFSYFTCFFASLFGPFPSLFPKDEIKPILLNFYGAGLMYRAFLVVPFWAGVYLAVKRFEIQLIPLLVFIIIEMLATAYVMASLELRKLLLHIPFMYIISFYALYHWYNSDYFKYLPEVAIYMFAIGVLFLWNVIRVS